MDKMDKEEIAKQENKTFINAVIIVTVLEVLFWLLFYWIHLKIRG